MRTNDTHKKQNAAENAVARLEPLEDRKYRSGSQEIGINVNDSSSRAYAESLPVLKAVGVTSVRLWYGIDQWSDRKIESGLARAIDYHNQGYDVTVTIAIDDKQVPNPTEVKNWFAWAANNEQLKRAIDRWQVGNEVDSPNYFKGSLKQYVNNFLKPAAAELHKEGEKVISGSVSWNPEDVREMIGYGMLDHVDYVGYHPYAKGVALQKQRIGEIHDVVDGRKPIIATEWNVRGFENDKTRWAAALNDAYGQVRSGFEIDYYFCLFLADTPAGPAGLMSNKGVINRPFYNAFLKASKGVGSSTPLPSKPSTPSKPSVPSNPGNTPSQTETKVALYNADTDRVISGYTDIRAGEVIDLADLPTRNVAIIVVPTKNASSVRMNLNGDTRVQSAAPYAFFGDNKGDFTGKKMTAGDYTLAVTPYKADNAGGAAFTKRTINFKLIDSDKAPTKPSTPTKPTVPTPGTNNGADRDKWAEVESFSLIDSKTGRIIKGYENITKSTTIRLSSLTTRSLALMANADEDTKSVRLTEGGHSHVENALPYAVFADNQGKFATWKPTAGSYHIGATAFGGKSASGAKGSTLSITLKFV